MSLRHRALVGAALGAIATLAACRGNRGSAELILTNGRVYSFRWNDPAPDGTPARNAPYDSTSGWHPDASAIAIHNGRIIYVGTTDSALQYRRDSTRVIDLAGKTVLPGLVDPHVQVAELGARLLSLDSARAFQASLAVALGGTSRPVPPAGPPTSRPTVAQLMLQLRRGLDAMAAAGYTTVHESDIGAREILALHRMSVVDSVPIRIYGMLSARDTGLLINWFRRGADSGSAGTLTMRAVEIVADGPLSSHDARLLEPYADRPSTRGPSAGGSYDSVALAELMKHQFQLIVDATGDAAVREALDFVQRVMATNATAAHSRVRIERAAVISPDDIRRFIMIGAIASVDPTSAVDAMSTADSFLGPDQVPFFEPWRSLRMANARLIVGLDRPGTNPDEYFFSTLSSAITRQRWDGGPTPGAGHPEQALTPEEVIRASTTWAAYAAYDDTESGTISRGMRGDLTVLTIDPLEVTRTDAGRLHGGTVAMTIVGGKVVFTRR